MKPGRVWAKPDTRRSDSYNTLTLKQLFGQRTERLQQLITVLVFEVRGRLRFYSENRNSNNNNSNTQTEEGVQGFATTCFIYLSVFIYNRCSLCLMLPLSLRVKAGFSRGALGGDAVIFFLSATPTIYERCGRSQSEY